jgi:serine protease AprX
MRGRVILPGAALLAAMWLGSGGPALAENVPAFRARADSLGRPPGSITLRGHRGRMPAAHASVLVLTPRPDSLKIHPRLREAIRLRPGSVDTVLVTFRDPFAGDTALIHHFTGSDAKRRPTRRQFQLISDSLVAGRAPVYQRMADTLRAYGATVLPPRFRLVQALLVTIRLGILDSLARNPSVTHIDPLHGGPPPSVPCGSKDTPVSKASSLMGVPHYLALRGFATGKLAILDTGVRQSHALLSAGSGFASPLTGCFECVSDTACHEEPNQVDVHEDGHGTATAAILAGNASMGQTNRGLTQATLDSYRVYDPPGESVNYLGAPGAFDHAVLDRDHDLIVAEIADGAGYGPLCDQANWAYDLSTMVIAANGNGHDGRAGHPDVIPQPAAAARVIGVGSYCIIKGQFDDVTIRGTTPDGRIKPDVGGLSSLYTARNGPQETSMDNYPLTSGATPSVAAAALLLANWMKGGAALIDPGQVYAMLILCGGIGTVDRDQGAGLIGLPGEGALLWHAEVLDPNDSLEIEIPQGGVPFSRLDAAIWWPELGTSDGGGPSSAERAWLALRIEDPDRTTVARSDVVGSVYQRARLSTSSVDVERPWFLTLLGNSIPEGQRRTVYWAIWGQK